MWHPNEPQMVNERKHGFAGTEPGYYELLGKSHKKCVSDTLGVQGQNKAPGVEVNKISMFTSIALSSCSPS